MSETPSQFKARQEEAKKRINAMDKGVLRSSPQRTEFFEAVYDQAEGDAAMVPWADLAPKQELANWLEHHAGNGKRAVDVGCGLGDNAQAISAAGYKTLGFDFSQKAIDWASQRFSQSDVDYQFADLFDLPKELIRQFDLVHECYTLQSIPPETLDKTIPAIASLVAPNGTLLVYTRTRPDGADVEGPPWPLEETRVQEFEKFGLTLIKTSPFIMHKTDRTLPHRFDIWERQV